jgi:branched-chain amino acid transport system substrate-binding protein
MKHHGKWWRGSLSLMLATVAVLTACKKPEESAGGGTGGGASSDAPAGGTIPVGEYASLTGKEAAFGQSSHKGTLLAVEEINKAGGVLGKQLKLITEDTQSKQGEAATGVRKLVSRDKVIAVLGEVASGRSLEGASVCQPAKIPMISPSSTNPKVTEAGDYIFRVCFTDDFQGQVLAKFGKESLKAGNVAVLTDATAAYSEGLANYFTQHFTKFGGKITGQQKYNGGDKDFRAQLTAIKAQNAEGIFVPGYYTDVGLIVSQARQLGMNIPVFGGDGWEAPQLYEIGGEALKNTYYTTHFYFESTEPKVQEFVKSFKARFSEVPDAMAALGYDSAYVLVDAIKRAGTTESAKLREALAGTKNFAGVTGTTTIDAQRNASKSAVILTLKGKTFALMETVNP